MPTFCAFPLIRTIRDPTYWSPLLSFGIGVARAKNYSKPPKSSRVQYVFRTYEQVRAAPTFTPCSTDPPPLYSL